MKKVILDTNFILHCIKQKIDFFEFFELEGFKVLVPDKVLFELRRISMEKKGELRLRAKLALNLIQKMSPEIIEIKGKYVDSAIVNYLKENPKDSLATLDMGLRRKVKNRFFILRLGKKIEEV
jgi:rRNA-processing protein FCF1